MTAETINISIARRLLKAVVEAKGEDFHYCKRAGQKCLYRVMTDKDSALLDKDDPRRFTPCIVGACLDLHGETRHRESTGNVLSLQRSYPDMMDVDAAMYFQKAQSQQDEGKSWGRARHAAEEYALYELGVTELID
jgi:hypothetical protein